MARAPIRLRGLCRRRVELPKLYSPMPKVFLSACVVAIFAFLAQAVLAPFYEVGVFVYISPVLLCIVSYMFLAVILRKPWGWKWVFQASWAMPAINLLFPPAPEFFGELITIARLLIGLEVLACLVVFVSMLRPAAKIWFTGPER